jgi:hypothetical protein
LVGLNRQANSNERSCGERRQSKFNDGFHSHVMFVSVFRLHRLKLGGGRNPWEKFGSMLTGALPA